VTRNVSEIYYTDFVRILNIVKKQYDY